MANILDIQTVGGVGLTQLIADNINTILTNL
jgi:hypothetical protein